MLQSSVDQAKYIFRNSLRNLNDWEHTIVRRVYEKVSQAAGVEMYFERSKQYITGIGLIYKAIGRTGLVYELEIASCNGYAMDYTLKIDENTIIAKKFKLPNEAQVRILKNLVYYSIPVRPCKVTEFVEQFNAALGMKFTYLSEHEICETRNERIVKGILYSYDDPGEGNLTLAMQHIDGYVMLWELNSDKEKIASGEPPRSLEFLNPLEFSNRAIQ